MGKKNTAVLIILPLAGVLFSPGCATLTRSKMQRIPVTSSPVGATVIVNGTQQGVTPLEIRVARKGKGQIIRIESSGYNPVEIRPQRKMSAGPILGNFLLGAIPGIGGSLVYVLTTTRCQAEPGYNTGLAVGWLLGTAAFGGVFTLIDSGSKGYELTPKELTVTLTKADGTPRVDTMLVEAEDFRNIKWIRVHRD
jgi:hypothetical protein